ncbi:DNA-binding protein [Sulfuriroseicoccus oceanibius]|uniref:DNA-binding protein n=1 Tax=Sulfuriroseicoccus oceanibius TaxID=2707525 RepID=A0A6B3L7Z2_9BACT|nr:DNA-binding protein [Sulfuriroseicoccus oceanibius]QQL45383.1 DNA-binding protein [Sulfuriroseicoccus oceanibius]
MNDYYDNQSGGGRRDHEPLHTEKIFTDRKTYFLDLKENQRGRFVKITEDVKGRRDTILVPTEALDEFIAALETIRTENESA